MNTQIQTSAAQVPNIMQENLALIKATLAQTNSLGVVKEIHDKTSAMKQYCQLTKASTKLLNEISEIRIRAQHKAGTLLAEIIKAGKPQLSVPQRIGLNELGIDKSMSSQWQKIAKIPESVFETFLNGFKDSNKELTTAATVKYSNSLYPKNKTPKPVNPDIENLLERLKTVTNTEINWERYKTDSEKYHAREIVMFHDLKSIIDEIEDRPEKFKFIQLVFVFLRITLNQLVPQ